MNETSMIVLFTDFGIQDPYVGQLKSVIMQHAPRISIIDLLHQVPDYDIKAASYLLPAYVREFPLDSIFICVVDPGVGSSRQACVAQLDGRWFVGPENGLFSVLQQRSTQVKWWHILTSEFTASASFHGRDIFAPIAVKMVMGDLSGLSTVEPPGPENGWPADLSEIVYIDHYGNLISGFRFSQLPTGSQIQFKGEFLPEARTFSDVDEGSVFYYENANGLLEIAVNKGNAQSGFDARLGDGFTII